MKQQKIWDSLALVPGGFLIPELSKMGSLRINLMKNVLLFVGVNDLSSGPTSLIQVQTYNLILNKLPQNNCDKPKACFNMLGNDPKQ